jgi:hypothetical protein
MNGVYFESKQNPDKTIEEIKEMVSKNLAKDGQYYIKNAAFGVKGIGYQETELEEVSGKHASSGYSDKLKKVVKESLMGGSIVSTGNPNSISSQQNEIVKEIADEVDESYDEFQRDDKGAKDVDKKDKGEEDAYGAGVAKGEKIEKKKMKKESIDSKLAEIGKEAEAVKLEAQLNYLHDHIVEKVDRVNSINEDENLQELIDKSKMKQMQKEIRLLEKRKAKMEKIYEKMCGKKYQKEEIVDEEMVNGVEVEEVSLENESAYAINEGGFDTGGTSDFGVDSDPVWEIPSDAKDVSLEPFAGKFVIATGGGGQSGNPKINQITPVEKDSKQGWKKLKTLELKPSAYLSDFGKVKGYFKKDKSDPDFEAKKAAINYTMKPEDRDKKKKVRAAIQSGDLSTLTFKKKDGQMSNLKDDPIKNVLASSK